MGVRLPDGLSRSVALADGHQVLIAGGLTANGTVSTILAFDPAAATITSVGNLPTAVHDAGGGAAGSTLLVAGGGNATPVDSVQSVASDGTSTSVGTLPKPRADLSAASIGDQLFIAGGGDPPSVDPRVLSTTDGAHFTDVAKLQQPVRYAAVAALDNKIYVIGGEIGTGDTSDVQVVDIASGTVTQGPPLPEPLSHAAAVVLNGAIYVLGGRNAGKASGGIERIDPIDGSVSVAGRLPYKVSDAAATVVDGTAYLIGGESKAPLDSVVAITPTSSQ
jgi:N-acetylneuraminic acid mutarotase